MPLGFFVGFILGALFGSSQRRQPPAEPDAFGLAADTAEGIGEEATTKAQQLGERLKLQIGAAAAAAREAAEQREAELMREFEAAKAKR
jgi:hypothetical protein